jgi:ankyrin repeat protein
LKVEGIDVNQANDNGETPLYWATYTGRKEIVSMLRKSGARELVKLLNPNDERL